VFAYLDAAVERIQEAGQREFHDAVEAARIGYVTATDRKALAHWRAMQSRLAATATAALAGPGGHGLAGEALERTLRAMAVSNPDIVAVRVAANG